MKKPDIPKNEKGRIDTVQSLNILDTPPEDRFDRLARIAKRLFDVPIALVSIVDENRVWFKSSIGLIADTTPRDTSFCGHAILDNEVFVIPNTEKDARFMNNPLVLSDPSIRFYAGCPLIAPDGHKLGTLCIIDQKPRNLGREDLETLKDLASMAATEIAASQLATLDELTQIANRRGFMLLADYSQNLCIRQKNPAALIFLDLDKFKTINDKFGHSEGNRALIAFADLLKNACRDSDIFARLGGDEFVILLNGTSDHTPENFITRFRQSLEEYNLEANCGYEIKFSYGISVFNPDKHYSIEALLTESDSLMYEAKNARK